MERRKRPFCNIGTHQLTAGIAHDLNNLLTVILCHTDFIMSQTKSGDSQYDDLLGISQAAQISANLASQLMVINQENRTQPRRMNVNDIIDDSLSMLRRLVGTRIEVSTHLAPDLAPVNAVSDQMHRVLLNLAINARDAISGEGKLTIETANVLLEASARPGNEMEKSKTPPAERSAYVRIRVTDTGVGMDSDVKEHVFEPFFSRGKGRGVGLGLSLVYNFIRSHSGFITLKSEPGRGTTFEIFLPACSSGAVQPEVVNQ